MPILTLTFRQCPLTTSRWSGCTARSGRRLSRARCHELRIVDETVTWRIVYRLDEDAVVILDVFAKKTGQTPKHVIDTCKARLKRYDSA